MKGAVVEKYKNAQPGTKIKSQHSQGSLLNCITLIMQSTGVFNEAGTEHRILVLAQYAIKRIMPCLTLR